MKINHGKYYYEFLENVEKLRKEDDTCFICGSRNNCSPHHIIRVSENNRQFCEMQNIVFLCEYHHRKYHRIYGSGKGVNHKNFGLYCRDEFRRESQKYAATLEENIMEVMKTLPVEIDDVLEERPLREKFLNDIYQFRKRTYKERYESMKNIYKNNIEIAEKLTNQNMQLKMKNKLLNDELQRRQNIRRDESEQRCAASMSDDKWGRLKTAYFMSDATYFEKASYLQQILKEHIGKNLVEMDSKYVRITCKKHILITQIYDVLLLDDSISHELIPIENHNVIYFRLRD